MSIAIEDKSHNRVVLRVTLLLLLAPPTLPNAATNPAEEPYYAREQRIAEQIEPDIFDGEALWLTADDLDGGQRDFLSILIEPESAKGAVLILHGRDVSPEDANVAAPLRIGLAEAGWSTLAIQLPMMEKGLFYYDYVPILKYAHPRIEAGLKFLRDKGYQTVVLAAHSCGAHMANSWLNENGDSLVDGYAAMGLGTTDYKQDLLTPFPLAAMSVPILDIYGEREFPRPLSMVPERKAMLEKNGHPGSMQKIVPEADHWFHGKGDILTEMVAEWLNKVYQE